MNEIELEDVLDNLTSQPPPSRVIDLDLAITNGRRLRRRRRAVLGTTIVAVLVAILPAVGFTLHQVTHRDRSQSPVDVNTDVTPGPSAAPTRFDPLRLRLSPGWIRSTPVVVPEESNQCGRNSGRPRLSGFGNFTPLLYAAGVPLSQLWYASLAIGEQGELSSPRPGQPTPLVLLVGGKLVTWYGTGANLAPGSGLRRLGRGVRLEIGFGADKIGTIAARYATADAPTSTEQVRVPFAMMRLRPRYPWSGSFISHENGRYEGRLGPSATRTGTSDSGTGESCDSSSCGTIRLLEGDPAAEHSNATISGSPAKINYTSSGGKIVVFDVAGHAEYLLVADDALVRHLDKDEEAPDFLSPL